MLGLIVSRPFSPPRIRWGAGGLSDGECWFVMVKNVNTISRSCKWWKYDTDSNLLSLDEYLVVLQCLLSAAGAKR